MIYVHSFAVIKSTGVGILAPGTGGIRNPTTKHSLIDIFRKLHSEGHDLYNTTISGSH
jgi:hypothetical protein